MCLSFTVFEIQPDICWKSPILIHPTCIRHPRRGWPRSNFVEIFGIRKLESPGYRVVLFHVKNYVTIWLFCNCEFMFDCLYWRNKLLKKGLTRSPANHWLLAINLLACFSFSAACLIKPGFKDSFTRHQTQTLSLHNVSCQVIWSSDR